MFYYCITQSMLGTWLYSLSTCRDITKAQSVSSTSSDMFYLSSQYSSASTNLSLDDFYFYLTVCPERWVHLCWHLITSSPPWKIFLTEGKLLPLLFSSPPCLCLSHSAICRNTSEDSVYPCCGDKRLRWQVVKMTHGFNFNPKWDVLWCQQSFCQSDRCILF